MQFAKRFERPQALLFAGNAHRHGRGDIKNPEFRCRKNALGGTPFPCANPEIPARFNYDRLSFDSVEHPLILDCGTLGFLLIFSRKQGVLPVIRPVDPQTLNAIPARLLLRPFERIGYLAGHAHDDRIDGFRRDGQQVGEIGIELLRAPYPLKIDKPTALLGIVCEPGNRIWNDARPNTATLITRLLRDDLLRFSEYDRLRNRVHIKCFIETVGLLDPVATDFRGKLGKVLLGTLADDIGMTAPRVQNLGQIGLRYELLLGVFGIELPALSSSQKRPGILILPTGTLVIPFGFAKRTIWRRCKNTARKLLHANMKRVVRKEVRSVHAEKYEARDAFARRAPRFEPALPSSRPAITGAA